MYEPNNTQNIDLGSILLFDDKLIFFFVAFFYQEGTIFGCKYLLIASFVSEAIERDLNPDVLKLHN
jgi:hypothetical protein